MRQWLVQILVGALAVGSTPTYTPDAPTPDPPDLTGRRILTYDPRGDGRIVEVIGDLTAADRIAILVPGADTTVGNFDHGHGGVRRRSPSWQAHQLHRATNHRVPVIAWLGYDPPEGIGLAAARSSRARDGATELVRFVHQLTTDHPRATVTLIGHSYGSVLLGYAAEDLPPPVTDVVAIGSPGMGVHTAAELRTTARIWAGSAPDDWTRRLPGVRVLGLGHGTNPTHPDFGARPLDVAGAVGHDGYFAGGTGSLRSLGQVTAGCSSDSTVSPTLRTMTLATRSAISSWECTGSTR